MIQLNVVRSIHLILDLLSDSESAESRIPAELLKLGQRLYPLLQLEEQLTRKLNPVTSEEFEATQLPSPGGNGSGSREGSKELAVLSTSSWKGAFGRLVGNGRDSTDSMVEVEWDDPNEPGKILHQCSEDMIKLWQDPFVQELLQKQKLRLQDLAGL